MTQKDHKLGVFADQLKAQKEKAAQAEAAAQRAEEELKRLQQEQVLPSVAHFIHTVSLYIEDMLTAAYKPTMQDTERRNRLSRDSRLQALEERVLELQADLSAKEVLPLECACLFPLKPKPYFSHVTCKRACSVELNTVRNLMVDTGGTKPGAVPERRGTFSHRSAGA